MSEELRDQDYLEHIEEAIGRISRYVANKNEQDFMDDILVQDGVIRNLEIIGEAVTKLSPAVKVQYSAVPWGEIAGMRNRLIHGYFAVNLKIVWDTIQKVLPDFLAKIREIQRSRSKAG